VGSTLTTFSKNQQEPIYLDHSSGLTANTLLILHMLYHPIRYEAVAMANCDTPNVRVICLGYRIYRTTYEGKKTLIKKKIFFYSKRENWSP
jgi:hypothetical protein